MFSLATVWSWAGSLFGALRNVPAVVWLVLLIAAWGWRGHSQANALRASIAAQEAAQAQAVQAAERAAAKSNQTVGDNLVKDTTKRATHTRAAAERLRKRAAAKPAAPVAGAACSSDGPAVVGLRDETREHLIELADDADATADALRACQAYIRDVVKPELEPAQDG